LARLLGPLDIHPGQHGAGQEQVRGYRRDAFEDAIVRYVSNELSTRQYLNDDGLNLPFSPCQTHEGADSSKTANPSIATGLFDPLTLRTETQGDDDAGKRF
jgi:hypothetical protein